jgi:acetyltransferase-like isoleucine patch superfamily enzyme
MFVERFRNDSTTQTRAIPGDASITIAPLGEVILSEIEGSFEIGHYSTVNRSFIGAYGGIGVSSYVGDTEISRYTLIGSRVSVGGFEHPLSWLSTGAFQWGQSINQWKGVNSQIEIEIRDHNLKPEYKKTLVGSDCWIGNNAVVKSGIMIGHGAVIGAGSIVTKDVPPYAVVVGNPGRIIKYRFPPHIVDQLLSLNWWKWEPLAIAHISFSDIENALIQLGELSSS